jgi:drug/metabolite transporter (DMT)-like permease
MRILVIFEKKDGRYGGKSIFLKGQIIVSPFLKIKISQKTGSKIVVFPIFAAMIYLLCSILCSVLIGLVMKFLPKYGIHQQQAIVVNYATCVACATLHLREFPLKMTDSSLPWWPIAVGLGFIFIITFNSAAATVKYFGLTVSAIVQKMSIALSVPFAIYFYHDSAGLLKILGVFSAILSIILTNIQPKSSENQAESNKKSWLWVPILTFFGSLIIEVCFLKINHEKWIAGRDIEFVSTIFGTAGLLGFLMLLLQFWQKKTIFAWKNVLAGLALGIPNYGSMLFIFLALGSGVEGSRFFPVNNVGIIVVSTVAAVLFFREKLSLINWLGVGLAVLAILLISF